MSPTIAERSCPTCDCGDNGTRPAACPCDCWEPELRSWEPIRTAAPTASGFLRQDQTVKHDPPNSYGDCFRTTIANLIGLRVEEVPHFLEDGCDGGTCNTRLNEFLRPYGLGFFYIGGGLPEDFRKEIGLSGVWYEAGGGTERGTQHAGAFMDGELQHDPHPSHAGFTDLDSYWGIFVALRPWEHVAAVRRNKAEVTP